MSNLPKELKYAQSHAWAKLEADGLVRVGITDFAQDELGDVMFVTLPAVGQQVQTDQTCAVIESVKTASDLPSPVNGMVVAINESLKDAPEQINDAAYDAWLFCVQPDRAEEFDGLMDAAAYAEMIDE